jgi:CelD/BcsL family acetyltransferase involved in cellulose biosynthesis
VSGSVEWIESTGRFASLEPSWNDLSAGRSRPFDCHQWFAAWWKAFGDGARMSICVEWRDGELAALLPLMRPTNGTLAAMANVHTPVFRPLYRDEEALRAVAGEALRDGASTFEVPAIPSQDPALSALEAEAAEVKRLTLLEPQHVSPIVDTSGDPEEWRAGSKPRWGAPLERFRRKMGRDYEAEFAVVVPPEDLERELREGFEVEASGWKGQAGTAILSRPETTAFYTDIARAFHERDELRLSRIVLDGQLVAFDLCLLHGGRLYLLKTGFDERFRKLAPGLVMRLSVVERCFELGIEAHELLGDDTDWKRKFATGERAHRGFRAYARRPVAGARYAYRSGVRPLLKSAYKRVARKDGEP